MTGWPFRAGDITPTAAEMNAIIRAAVREALDQERAAAAIAEPPAESWQVGDVVRNADDPDDRRVWICDGTTKTPWLLPGDPETVPGYAWCAPEDVPANLTLIVRDGHPVLREPSDEELEAAQDAAYDLDWRAAARVLDERRGVIRP